MRKLVNRIVVASVITLLSGVAAQADGLKVVASFSIIADFARQVGGDRVEITTLVGPDGDAHVYEPRPTDAAAVAGADLVLVNGLRFEGFLPRLIAASGTTAPVVELTKGAELLPAGEDGHHDEGHGHAHEEKPAQGQHADAAESGHDSHAHADEQGHDEVADDGHHQHDIHDPHAWQSIPNAEVYVANIADAFCIADAAGCDGYRANAATYVATLKALDADLKTAVAAIPEARRTIITSHDAFGYLAHAYGLTFLAPEGVSTEAEASAADVAALIRQVREDKASAIFVESITNARLIEQIARETGLTIGGTLYSDSLSSQDGPAATYVDMMRHNIATIRAAIGSS